MAARKIPPGEEPVIASRYLAGEDLAALALAYGVSKQRIHQVLQSRGVPGRQRGPARRRDAVTAQAVALHGQGLTLKEIGQAVGLSHEPVRRTLQEAGVDTAHRLATEESWRCGGCGKGVQAGAEPASRTPHGAPTGWCRECHRLYARQYSARQRQAEGA